MKEHKGWRLSVSTQNVVTFFVQNGSRLKPTTLFILPKPNRTYSSGLIMRWLDLVHTKLPNYIYACLKFNYVLIT